MTSRTFWTLATGLWLCMIVAMIELDGGPRGAVLVGITLVWLGLCVERFRNWQRGRRG